MTIATNKQNDMGSTSGALERGGEGAGDHAAHHNALATAVNVISEAPLNVKYPEYGAVGDGSADDSSAFSSALAAVNGGELLVPSGDYKTDALNLDDAGLTLRGMGRGNTRLFTKRTDGQHFVTVTADDITIEGIEIDGMQAAQGPDTGTALVAGGATAGEKAKHFTLRDCIVRSNGFNTVATWDVDGFTIEGNDLYGLFDGTLDFLEGSRNGSAQGNTIYAAGRYGITADTVDIATYGYTRHISLANNKIVLSAGSPDVQWGIVLLSCWGIGVAGNPIDCSSGSPNGGIRCVNRPVRFSLVGNPITGTSSCTDGGISIDAAQVASFQDFRGSIVGNAITGFSGSGKAGIRNYVGNRLQISGNVVDDCYYGILAECNTSLAVPHLSILGNTVQGGNTSIRLVKSGSGTGVAKLMGNEVGNASSADYTFDAGWTVDQSGLVAMAAARAANNSAYIDSGDGKLYFKDSGGVARALY